MQIVIEVDDDLDGEDLSQTLKFGGIAIAREILAGEEAGEGLTGGIPYTWSVAR